MSRQRSHVAIGPGSASLILMIVVVSMSILCTLAVLSARSDERLSRRHLSMVQENYTLYDRSERTLSQLAALLAEGGALPEGVSQEGDMLYWTEETENRGLSCAAQILHEDGKIRLVWAEHSLWTDSGEEEEWD